MAAGAATATALASTVHGSSVALGDAASGLRAHVVGDGVVDFSELTVAVGVLTVFIPLAEPFVLEVAALLGLEALVYWVAAAAVASVASEVRLGAGGLLHGRHRLLLVVLLHLDLVHVHLGHLRARVHHMLVVGLGVVVEDAVLLGLADWSADLLRGLLLVFGLSFAHSEKLIVLGGEVGGVSGWYYWRKLSVLRLETIVYISRREALI
jgi:hypothetical protein